MSHEDEIRPYETDALSAYRQKPLLVVLPEKIEEVTYKINEGWDFVKVSRYYGIAKSYDDNLITGFGNKLFNFLIKIFYGFKTSDALGIYYGVNKKLFETLKINFNNTAINTELMIKSKIFDILLYLIQI